jgi:hypothetical protein
MLTFDHLGDSQIFTATDRVHNWTYRFRVRRITGRKTTVYLLVCETGRPLSSALSLSGAECAVLGLLDPTPQKSPEITQNAKA